MQHKKLLHEIARIVVVRVNSECGAEIKGEGEKNNNNNIMRFVLFRIFFFFGLNKNMIEI